MIPCFVAEDINLDVHDREVTTFKPENTFNSATNDRIRKHVRATVTFSNNGPGNHRIACCFSTKGKQMLARFSYSPLTYENKCE